MASPVRLDIQQSASQLQSSQEQQLLYLLVEVASTVQQAQAKGKELNLSIVLDKSGSMYAGQKLDYLIRAVHFCIDQLRPSDYCSIIAFADRARVVIPSNQIYDKTSAQRIVSSLESLDVGSGTELVHGIRAGVQELQRQLSPERNNHMIILTDGLTMDEGWCKEECLSAYRHGISTSTIGLGDDFNEDFLLKIANNCGGNSYYIDRAQDIPQIFQEELLAAQQVAVQSPQLTLELAKDVFIRKAHKVKPMINQEEVTTSRSQTFSFGNLLNNEEQSMLFELAIPSRSPGTYRLAEVSLNYLDSSLAVPQQEIGKDVVIEYTASPPPAQKVNGKILQVLDAVSVFKQQTRALELAESGQTDAATQLLQSAATQLLNQGQSELAEQAFLEAGRIAKGSQATSHGKKKLQYGTRKLTQLLPEIGSPE